MKNENQTSDLTMKFINDVSPILKPYIRHYWITEGAVDKTEPIILLPMDHIDIIIPLCGKFYYENFDYVSDADGIVFHGMRSKAFTLKQDGYVLCYGISFEPWGFYPFIQKSLIKYLDRVVALSSQNKELSILIRQCIDIDKNVDENIENLEKVLIDIVAKAPQYSQEIEIIKSFTQDNPTTVKSYCDNFSINRKRLERIFNKFVGISPKDFLMIQQFEQASRDVMFDQKAKLTDIALDENYYDQAHFTKSFKQYTDYSPTDFKKKKPALKSKFKFK